MARRRSQAVPLDRDASGRYLPLLVAIMVYLAALALAGALAMHKLAERWDTGLAGALTVQLPAESGKDGPELAAVVAALRATPGVLTVETMDNRAMNALLEPWLGDAVPAAVQVIHGLDGKEHHKVDCRRLLGVGEPQDGRDERPGVRDADPENEVDDVETPVGGPRDAGHAHALGELCVPGIGGEQDHHEAYGHGREEGAAQTR